MKIVRVFPRRTRATPNDDLSFVGSPTLFAEADRVHVSVTFTWDIARAEHLAEEWKYVAPVEIGGPAVGTKGGDFEPGKYLKPGYVITSRGCPNKCWFCSVWTRDGNIRELPITEGWNLLDDNLLACSEEHIRAVFQMLSRQPHQIELTGGLEAARLKNWHVRAISRLNLKQAFFAYDTPDDYEPLLCATELLKEYELLPSPGHKIRCYVLIGFSGDTIEKAEKRLRSIFVLGITPMAMLWRNDSGKTDLAWRRFQRQWARPAIIYGRGHDTRMEVTK